MARSDPAVSLRVPALARGRRVDRPEASERPRFRLVVTRGHLAMELDQRVELAPLPLSVQALSLSLPDIEFPVELSGGVAAFRNRRGRFEHLRLVVPSGPLNEWGRVRLGALLGAEASWVAAPIEDGWLVGVCDGERALAFEVLVAPLEGDLRLIPTVARAIGFDEPPQTLAVRLLAALLKPFGTVVGGALVVEQLPRALATALLPSAGMRVPDCREIRVTSVGFDVSRSWLTADRDQAPAPLSSRVISAVELATLVAEAEQALLSGAPEQARRHYLAALERAPRHPETSRRLAELDALDGERNEAALSTLGDAMLPAEAGILGGRLLAAVGDREGAVQTLKRAAEQEPYGPLAALCLQELAKSVDDRDHAERILDEAVARAPSLASVRWKRFEERARAGRFEEAHADLEHLAAACRGARERHRCQRRAAELYGRLGAFQRAVDSFERALRYVPDSVEAVAGLARSLAALGHERRALELASRAAALEERAGRPAGAVTLQLAKLLADVADDRSAAIGHVRIVAPFTPYGFEARLLEARWRAELGDLSGASVSLGRLADAVQAAIGALVPGPAGAATQGTSPGALWAQEGDVEGEPPPYGSREDARRAIATMLQEGARIQEIDRNDAPAARRLLELAIQLAPRQRSLQQAHRRLLAASQTQPRMPPPPAEVPVVDERTRPVSVGRSPFSASPSAVPPARDSAPEAEPLPREPSVPTARGGSTDRDGGLLLAPDTTQAPWLPGEGDTAYPDDDAIEDEIRVEELTGKLRANPADEACAWELIDVLDRLGRDHDMLALLSARIDEGSNDREAMAERRRALLERMVGDAEAAGRHDEAALYRLMLERND